MPTIRKPPPAIGPGKSPTKLSLAGANSIGYEIRFGCGIIVDSKDRVVRQPLAQPTVRSLSFFFFSIATANSSKPGATTSLTSRIQLEQIKDQPIAFIG